MATSEKQLMENGALPTTTSTDLSAPAKKGNEYLTGFKLFITIFSLTCVGFLMLLDVSVVSTAIPKITSDFHSLNDVGWYGSAYLLTQCAIQPLSGRIYTEFGMKWTFLCFFAVFEIGSAVCGAATSSTMLIIGRAIAGLGSAGLLNGGYSIIHASAPLEKQPFILGTLIGVSQLGILLGPLLGGVLTQYASWRWCFYINLPCGGVATILLVFFLSVPARKDAGERTLVDRLLKLDLIGFSFFAPAAIQFILALEWGGIQYPWNSATIIGLFCGAFGMLLIFVAWEYSMGGKAMIPLSIIRKRVIWSSCINYAFFAGSMLSATYYLPIYFQSVKNASPTMSGVDLLPSIIATALVGVLTGAFIGRIGYYLPFGILSGALTCLGSGLISTFTPTTSTGVWIGYQIIVGAGRGMGFQIPLIAVQNNSTKEEVSIVNALVVFAQTLGGAVFLSLDQIIFGSSLRHYLAIFAPEINPQVVIAAGARGLHKAVPEASLPGAILAYGKSFDRVMYLATGCSGGAILLAFGMGWINIKKKAEDEKIETSSVDLEATASGVV